MLKSISIWALQEHENRPAEELFSEARQCGFEAIELAVGEKGLLTPESTEAQCGEILKKAESAGIRVSSLASGLGWRYPLSETDAQVRRKGIEVQKQVLRIGGWLGVDCMLLVPGQLSALGAKGHEHVPYDVAYENMRASIAELVPVAEQAGVKIGVENVWNKVLLSPLEMRDFIDSFGTPWVASYLDVGNMIVTGYAEDWVRILGRRVASVHFKDYKREVGTLEGFCDLLEGDVNYPAVMAALRDVGYDGPCVAEFFGLPPEGLRRVSEAMDKIFAM